MVGGESIDASANRSLECGSRPTGRDWISSNDVQSSASDIPCSDKTRTAPNSNLNLNISKTFNLHVRQVVKCRKIGTVRGIFFHCAACFFVNNFAPYLVP